MTTRIIASQPILNREARLEPSGRYMVAHKGDHPVIHAGSRLIQRVDDLAVDTMVNRFNAQKAAEPSFEMLVDRDHFANNADLPSEAYGWLTALENRNGNLYGEIRWTDIGKQAVENRRYRFLSPEWFPQDCETVEANIIRPLQLARVSVTNGNNIKSNAPLVNRNEQPPKGGKESTMMDYKAEFLALLGLAADATEAKILEAKTAIANRLKVDVTAIENRATAAEGKVAEYAKKELDGKVEKALADFAGVIQNRDAMKTSLAADYEKTLAVLQSLKPVQEAAASGPVMNRAAGSPPATENGNADDKGAKQRDLVETIKNRESLKAGKVISFERAWELARLEQPVLFKN